LKAANTDTARPPRGDPWLEDTAAPAIATLADAVRRCREIAAELNASGFGIYVVGQSVAGTRLLPCLDHQFPDLSAGSARIAGPIGEEVARHARVSTVPCWWMGGEEPPPQAVEQLDWMALTSTLVPGATGIAFPVHAERGLAGVTVFFGSNPTLDTELLIDVHARCFALFAAVAPIRPAQNAPPPAMSRRELECLKLTANGHTSEEIARLLNLSVHTANQYLTQTTQKLDAVNRVHAVAKALRLGLIE
jgi:DNA-binding CsgD family transcriptional regulator